MDRNNQHAGERAGAGRRKAVKRGEWLASLVAAGLALVADRGSNPHGATPRPAVRTTYFSAPLPFAARDLAVSPNGHTVAVVGYRESERKNLLWIYEPGSQEASSLAHTEDASFPLWCLTDGHWVLCRRETEED